MPRCFRYCSPVVVARSATESAHSSVLPQARQTYTTRWHAGKEMEKERDMVNFEQWLFHIIQISSPCAVLLHSHFQNIQSFSQIYKAFHNIQNISTLYKAPIQTPGDRHTMPTQKRCPGVGSSKLVRPRRYNDEHDFDTYVASWCGLVDTMMSTILILTWK